MSSGSHRFVRTVLRQPTYGWVSATNRPSDATIRGEFLRRLDPRAGRHQWLPITVWTVNALFLATLLVYLVGFFTWSSLAVGVAYAFLFLPQYGTFYFHRYGTHRAWRFAHPAFAFLAKHAAIRVIPEEVYIVSHHVHHTLADADGDPYDPRGGWWYCFLADVNHQAIATDLDADDHARARGLLSHLFIGANDYAGYQRWGSIVHPAALAADLLLNWLFWAGLLTLVGGPSLALAVFGCTTFWLWGIRNFNFLAHGRGGDERREGEDFHRADLSVNRTLSAWLASEWHNNHHLFPRSARAGFLPYQLDVVWWTVRALAAVGIIASYRDDTERFYVEHYRPWLESRRA